MYVWWQLSDLHERTKLLYEEVKTLRGHEIARRQFSSSCQFCCSLIFFRIFYQFLWFIILLYYYHYYPLIFYYFIVIIFTITISPNLTFTLDDFFFVLFLIVFFNVIEKMTLCAIFFPRAILSWYNLLTSCNFDPFLSWELRKIQSQLNKNTLIS